MSYSEYEFGDFRKYYEGGIDAGLVGFAEGFAKGFVPTYQQAVSDRRKQEDELFRLAVEDIQKQEERRARANTRGSNDQSAADRIAAMFPGVPGVRAYAYNALAAGQTANAVISDLQSGIKEDRIRVVTPEGAVNPFEPAAAPAQEETAPVETPAAEPAPEQTSAIDQEMGAAFTISSKSPDTTEFDAALTAEGVELPSIRPDNSSFTGEEIQVADASGNWFTALGATLSANRNDLINRNVNRRLEEWKALTGRSAPDPTTPSGLVSSPTSARPATTLSTEVQSGTPSDVAVGTLTIIPKATGNSEDSSLALKPINEISNVNEAIVAATLAQQSDDPEAVENGAIAEQLIPALANLPKIGDMTSSDLNILVNTPQDQAGPEYRGLTPEVYANIQAEAAILLETKQRESLPSLNFDSSVSGEGLLADVQAGRYGDLPDTFVSQLNDRIQALKQRESMDFGDTFDEGDYDRLAAQKAIELQDVPGAFAAWEAGVGAQLRTIIRDQIAPTTYSSPEQAATNVFMRDAEERGMTPEQIQEGLVSIKSQFSTQETPKFTSADLAGLQRQYRQMLISGTDEEKAQAQAWFDTELPALEAILKSAADAGREQKPAEPAEERLYQVRNADGSVDSFWGREVEGGVEASSSRGTVISWENIVGSESMDAVDTRTREVSRFPPQVAEAGQLTQDATTFAVQAKSLEDVAQGNPEILTLGGTAASILSNVKTQLNSVLEFGYSIGQGAEVDGSIDEQTSSIMNVLNQALAADTSMSDATKSAYRQYVSESVLLIFAAGRALGQTGQGFSNTDYKVIRDALVGANSVEDLSRVLRKFAAMQMEAATANAQRMRQTTQVQSTLALPGVTEGSEFMSAQELLAAQGRDDVWEWASSAPELNPSQPTNTTTQPAPLSVEEAIAAYQNGQTIIWTEELAQRYPELGFTVGSRIKGQ